MTKPNPDSDHSLRTMRDALWRAIYAEVDESQTSMECDFIEHVVPRRHYRTVLDLACGSGRHACELARRGYVVTGVDSDTRALAAARAVAEAERLNAHFIELDIRNMDVLGGTYDAIMLFWQSFGFFVGESQVRLFREAGRLLAPRGRMVLDLYNRLHFSGGPTPFTPTIGTPVSEAERLTLMTPHLDDLVLREQVVPSFTDPTLMSPGEIGGLASNYGLHLIASCSDYSPTVAATADRPRMQLVVEKE